MRYLLLFRAAALLASVDLGDASPCRPASSATIPIDVESTSTFFSSFPESLSTEISTVSLDAQTDTIKTTTETSPTEELSTATTEFTATGTPSEASLTTTGFTAEVLTTDTLPGAINDLTETVSSIQFTDIVSTATTSPAETPTYTNLVKNGDFRLVAQQGELLHGFETNLGRLTTQFGYTGSGSDETNGAMLQANLISPLASNLYLKQKISIPKGCRVAARLMYSLREEPATSYRYTCNLIMYVQGKIVAQKRFAGDLALGMWMPLEGEADAAAGDGDLFVVLQCSGTRGNVLVVVDQIVVSDEVSLGDLLG
ncbi:hypothetical protein NW768_010050 [Fusarium equiseti]|uniref:CBM-cenC domain-containing protein n=1 Tax=Fusarium equiseti TaxID=61235 RepID=A0ABQ8R1U1_FUSEQ|nr:hypothetical protein NW768_010050 [Fusarium equiseti]